MVIIITVVLCKITMIIIIVTINCVVHICDIVYINIYNINILSIVVPRAMTSRILATNAYNRDIYLSAYPLGKKKNQNSNRRNAPKHMYILYTYDSLGLNIYIYIL